MSAFQPRLAKYEMNANLDRRLGKIRRLIRMQVWLSITMLFERKNIDTVTKVISKTYWNNISP